MKEYGTEGLKVPQKQPGNGRRLWFNDGSCIRLKPLYKNHVWSYDFVFDRTSDGKVLKMLNVLDEYSNKIVSTIYVDRRINIQKKYFISYQSYLYSMEYQIIFVRIMGVNL